MSYPPRFCTHCAARLRGGTETYELLVCSKCLLNLPEYKEYRRTKTALRVQKYYERNREKELERQKTLRRQSNQRSG